MSALYHPYKGKGGGHHGPSLISNKNQSKKKNDGPVTSTGKNKINLTEDYKNMKQTVIHFD